MLAITDQYFEIAESLMSIEETYALTILYQSYRATLIVDSVDQLIPSILRSLSVSFSHSFREREFIILVEFIIIYKA